MSDAATQVPRTAVLDVLRGRLDGELDPGRDLWGFGGVHGGLSLALLAAAMQERVPHGELRGITGQFRRPLRGPFRIDVDPVRSGRSATTASARAVAGDRVHVTAIATFAAGSPAVPVVAPIAPPAPPPQDCEPFALPLDVVPFSGHTELRPVGPNRPFAGGGEPVLTAWLRLTGGDDAPDALGLIFLMDSLAPSYAAVLSSPAAVPTVELGVRLTGAVASQPWVLLQARTRWANGDGWVDEQLDAWAPDGTHLGSGHQLRLVLAA